MSAGKRWANVPTSRAVPHAEGWPVSENGTVAGRRDLAREQVEVVDHVVAPHAARVLVEAHRPERHDLDLRVGIQLRERLQPVLGNAAELGGVLEIVGGNELREVVEGDRLGAAGVARVLGALLQRMLRPQSVADVGIPEAERRVLVNEIAIDAIGLDDVMGDVVEDRQIGLRSECELDVRQLVGPVLEGRQHCDLDVASAQPTVGHPGPEDWMHLRHVGTPQHERIRGLDVVITAHRLVGAEGTHEPHGGGSHAVARVGIQVVGPETGFHQLQCRITLPDRPLAGAEHAYCGRPLVLEHALPLLGHHIEGLVPGDALELAVLGVLPILHAQQRRRQPIIPVHDLRQEITLDAVEALVHFGVDVAVRGDDAVVLHPHRHTASGAAEAARRLGPFEPGVRHDPQRRFVREKAAEFPRRRPHSPPRPGE